MKIVIYTRQDGSVGHVYSYGHFIDKGWDEKKIEEKVNEANQQSQEKEGRDCYKTIEVTDELEEVMNLLLGEKKYKRQKDFEDILDSLEEVDSTLSTLQRDVFDSAEALEQIKKHVENMKEEFEAKGKKK